MAPQSPDAVPTGDVLDAALAQALGLAGSPPPYSSSNLAMVALASGMEKRGFDLHLAPHAAGQEPRRCWFSRRRFPAGKGPSEPVVEVVRSWPVAVAQAAYLALQRGAAA
jgi:hypothetical protein